MASAAAAWEGKIEEATRRVTRGVKHCGFSKKPFDKYPLGRLACAIMNAAMCGQFPATRDNRDLLREFFQWDEAVRSVKTHKAMVSAMGELCEKVLSESEDFCPSPRFAEKMAKHDMSKLEDFELVSRAILVQINKDFPAMKERDPCRAQCQYLLANLQKTIFAYHWTVNDHHPEFFVINEDMGDPDTDTLIEMVVDGLAAKFERDPKPAASFQTLLEGYYVRRHKAPGEAEKVAKIIDFLRERVTKNHYKDLLGYRDATLRLYGTSRPYPKPVKEIVPERVVIGECKCFGHRM